MKIIAMDASILIGLRKASALTLLTRLPHELMTANFIFNELQRHKRHPVDLGSIHLSKEPQSARPAEVSENMTSG